MEAKMNTSERAETRPKKTPMVAIAVDIPLPLLHQLDSFVSELGERRNPQIRQAIREFLQRAAENEARG